MDDTMRHRPPRATQRTSKGNLPIQVRHTDEQRDRWQRAAERAGMSYSEWVRDTLDAAAGQVPEVHHQIRPDNCPHPGWRKGAAGLLVCIRCGLPKVMVAAS